MTVAASELHLTQSGVSQHIRSLEDSLSIRLFDRVKQKILPTSHADDLYKTCSHALTQIESALQETRGGTKPLTGTVRIGMPIEFANNVLLPQLAPFIKKNPGVHCELRYDFATAMNEGLLSGALDFAFVDEFTLDRRITVKPIYDEALYLCASPALIKRLGGPTKDNLDYYSTLDFVDYQAGEPILKMWFKHHLGPRMPKLNVRATVMDVQGIARLIIEGVGAGVLPGHLVARLERDGVKLVKFRETGKPLKNAISLAVLSGRTLSPAAAKALEWLLQALKSQMKS